MKEAESKSPWGPRVFIAVVVMTAIFTLSFLSSRQKRRAALRSEAPAAAVKPTPPAPSSQNNATPAPEVEATPAGLSHPANWSIRFAVNQLPADKIRIRGLDADGHVFAEGWTNPDGTASPLPGASQVVLIDEVSSLTLALLSPPPEPGATIDVPNPMRLEGKLQPDVTPGLSRVWLGTGARETASTQMRRLTGSQLRERADEHAPWGVPLQMIPSQWQEARQESSIFVTPWFVFDAPVMILGHDKGAGIGVLDVPPPPDIQPRTTRSIGSIDLNAAASLEVRVEIPEGEAIDGIAMNVEKAVLDDSPGSHGGLLQSVLLRVDRRASEFAMGRGDVMLVGESTVVAPLPPMKEIGIVVRGITPAQIARRSVALPAGQTTVVEFKAEELFPVYTEFLTVKGRCVLEGTETGVADATIVANWANKKAETTSDENGNFTFDDVPTGEPLNFFVEAYDDHDPPRYSFSETYRFPMSQPGTKVHNAHFEIPGFRWMIVDDVQLAKRPDGSDPIVVLEHQDPMGAWTQWSGIRSVYFVGSQIEVEITRVGTWRILALGEDFVVRESQPVTFGEDDFEKHTTLDPVRSPRQAWLKVLDQQGKPATGVTIQATAPMRGLPPVDFTTDEQGVAQIGFVNVDSILMRIDDPRGVFGGEVKIGSGENVVRLEKPEDVVEGS